MRELKLYIVKFEKDGRMKSKVYHSDFEVGINNRQFIILITHNNCTFCVSNGV